MAENFTDQDPNAGVKRLAEMTRWKVRFTWDHLKNEVQADVSNLAYSVAFRRLLNRYNADLEKLVKNNPHMLKRVKDIANWRIRFFWDAKSGKVLEDISRMAMSPMLVKLNTRFRVELESLIRDNERMLT